jgi:hypothetical protein
MNTAEIERTLAREPFRPFSIQLHNGQILSVTAPRDVAANKDYSLIFYFSGGGNYTVIDRDSISDIAYPPLKNDE